MTLSSKRAVVWMAAIFLGLLGAAMTVEILGTTYERYGYTNWVLLAVSYTGLLWIWLDYFMKTDMIQK